ncbi:MAG: DMT family transporter [Geminicoccaceae bacterium]|nr:MAG: DMT family transporter [Geminicoccaceae bacterium]
MGCVTLNDALMKWLSPTYALHQAVFVRSLFSVGLLLAIAVFTTGLASLKTKRPGLHLLRGLLVIFINSVYFLALAAMPLAEAMAIFFVAPLFITLFSVPMLGERIGPWRLAAVVIGLLGVVVMLRPGGEGLELTALLPVAAAIAYAFMQLLTRRLGMTDRALTMTFSMQSCFLVFSLVVGLGIGDGRFGDVEHPSWAFLLRAWTWPEPHDVAILALCGTMVALGGILISQAYRLVEATAVAPFEYTALPIAVFWGWLMWGDMPDLVAWTGLLLIASGGLLVIWREGRRRRPLVAERPLPRSR